MGAKEESAKIVVIKGYSGKIRPNQGKGGKCVACGDDVYVDPDEHALEPIPQRVRFFHWSCTAP